MCGLCALTYWFALSIYWYIHYIALLMGARRSRRPQPEPRITTWLMRHESRRKATENLILDVTRVCSGWVAWRALVLYQQ